MKKLLILFSFFLFFNASLDESNIDIKLITIDSQTFEISWSVNIQDYDEILLEIDHYDTIERYQLLTPDGSIEMCCYADELEVILRYTFSYMQNREGSSVYIRLSTRNIPQIKREINKSLEEKILSGGYWLEKPKNKSNITIVFSGVIAPEVLEAARLIKEDDVNVSILIITSSDRLYKNWKLSQKERSKGIKMISRIDELFSDTLDDSAIVSVIDAHSSSLTWIGGAVGKKIVSLGVDEFGQSGNLKDLYQNYSIDADAIIDACAQVLSN